MPWFRVLNEMNLVEHRHVSYNLVFAKMHKSGNFLM